MYRVAIYSYKLTILNSVMIMVNKLIPMALLPRSDLEEILRDVNQWQSDTNERLSLAYTNNTSSNLLRNKNTEMWT